MKSGQTDLVEEAELEAREIAVGEEGLGMGGDGFEVEALEQVVGSVAAAQSHDGGGTWVGEGRVEIGEALLRGSSEVERSALARVGGEFGCETEIAQGREAEIDVLRLRAGGRGDDADGRAGSDRGRFQQSRHLTKPLRGR